MGSSSEESDGENATDFSWVRHFTQARGNEYFCTVDDEYLLDRFNLTGLGHDVPMAQQAYDLIVDSGSPPSEAEEAAARLRRGAPRTAGSGRRGAAEAQSEASLAMERVEASANLLYGLIHARFILTPMGMAKMKTKYSKGVFGHCPRIYCRSQRLLPTALSDIVRISGVKLYCPNCKDLYNPKSQLHYGVEGAFFSTTFAALFCLDERNLALDGHGAKAASKGALLRAAPSHSTTMDVCPLPSGASARKEEDSPQQGDGALPKGRQAKAVATAYPAMTYVPRIFGFKLANEEKRSSFRAAVSAARGLDAPNGAALPLVPPHHQQ